MTMPTQQELAGHAVMMCFAAIVAGSYAFGAMVANDMAPVALQALRFSLGAALVAVLVTMGPGWRRSDFAAPWRYLITGGIFALYFVLMFEALKTAPPVSTAAVFTLTPILTALFGWVLMGQRVGPRMKVALLIGALGAIWVVFRGDFGAMARFEIGRGEAIFFFGVVAHAIYIPLNQRLARNEHILVQTTGVLSGGAVILCVVGAGDLLRLDWSALPTRLWLTLGYLVVFASAGAFFCLQFAANRLPGAKVMAYGYLTPSWVILWEIMLGNGAPPTRVFLGIGFTLIALYLLLKREDPVHARV